MDTNVFYSAIHSPGSVPARVIEAQARGHFRAVVSDLVLTELLRTVRNKLPSAAPRLTEVLLAAPPEVLPDPPIEEVNAIAGSINRKDAPIVAAAIIGEVDYFVSGDSRLLAECRALKPPLPALAPRELMEVLPG